MYGWVTAAMGNHGIPLRVTPYQKTGPFVEFPVKAGSYTPPISKHANVNFDIEVCDGTYFATNVVADGTQWNGSYGNP